MLEILRGSGQGDERFWEFLTTAGPLVVESHDLNHRPPALKLQEAGMLADRWMGAFWTTVVPLVILGLYAGGV